MPPSGPVPNKPECVPNSADGCTVNSNVKLLSDKMSSVTFNMNEDIDNSGSVDGAAASETDAYPQNLLAAADEHESLEDIPTSLKQQSSWLDPFPTPCNSIGTNSAVSSRSSPLHMPEIDVFHPDFYNSPQRKSRTSSFEVKYLNASSLNTPVRNEENNRSGGSEDDNVWNDPFPTPDASIRSRTFPTPDSTRNVSDAFNDYQEWVNVNIPMLPCIDSPAHNRDESLQNEQPSPHRRRRSVACVTSNHKSAPSLLDTKPPPIRRISSEAGLFGRVPSMEDLLKRLSDVGPDGNDYFLSNAAATPIATNKKQSLQSRSSSGNILRQSLSQDDFTICLKPNTSKESLSGSNNFTRKQSKDDLDLLSQSNMSINSNTFPKTRLTPLLTPVRNLLAEQGRRASKVYIANSQRIKRKLRERRERRRQRREARNKEPPASWWIIIPADHPYKIIWDVLTMIWALLGAYRTHLRIRDRVFDQSPLIVLTEVWFTLDILLNFVTEHKTSKGQVIRDGKTVWARYLTTWFVIDLLSLIPWERIYVRPVVEKIKRRNFFQKTFFRSKAVVRVSRVLRGRHIKLIGQVSKQTGTPLRRIVVRLIKYVPKYLLFFRHMKGALFVRGLRFIHWLHNMYKKIWVSAQKAGRNARERIVRRRNKRHPIFDLVEENDDEKDTDSDTEGDDHSDEDDDDDLDESSHFDISEMTSMDVSEGDYGQISSHVYQRSRSENRAALRRRTYSEM